MNSWSEAKNILCIRLDAMGDLIMTTPAIKALKKAVSGRKITLLASLEGTKIAESIPLFEKVISYQAPWLKAGGIKNDPVPDLEMIQTIKGHNFDGVVIFSVYSQNPLPSALLSYYAGIPLRAAVCRENPYSLLTHWVKEVEPHLTVKHEVRRHLDLVQHLGASGENLPLTLMMDMDALESLEDKLMKLQINLKDKDWIIIHPGSTAESRRYHAEGFAELADLLTERTGRRILFTGTEAERDLISQVQSLMKNSSVNLGGVLSLKEMIALIGKSQLLISNNSGPVHMAAALGTPVIVLYALTNPQHTPWLIPHHVLYHDVSCKFCYKSICPEGNNACLNMIKPETIFEKACELLNNEDAPCFDFKAIHPLNLTVPAY